MRKHDYSVKSGLVILDDNAGGFNSSDLTIVAGGDESGKTSFVLTAIKNICQNKSARPVLFSLDLTFDRAKLKIQSQLKENIFENSRLIIDDKPDYTVETICRKAEKYVRWQKRDIIFIDCRDFLTTDDETKTPSEKQAYIVQKLKSLARKLNVPVVCTFLLSGDAFEEPQLSELKNFEPISLASDVVVLMSRAKQNNHKYYGCGKLNIAKNRNGVTDSTEIYFDYFNYCIVENYLKFSDIEIFDDRAVQIVIKNIESQDLAKALKASDEKVQEKFFKNMSRQAKTMLLEDMEFIGPIPLDVAMMSQREIEEVMNRLNDEGEIVVAKGMDFMHLVE